MPDHAPTQLTPEQQERLLQAVHRFSAAAQVTASALVEAFLPTAQRLAQQLAELQGQIQVAAESRVPVRLCPIPESGEFAGSVLSYGPCIVAGRHIRHEDANGETWVMIRDTLPRR